MSVIKQWLTDIALLPDFDVKQMRPFKISQHSQSLGKDELAQALKALGSVSGWLQETSRVVQLNQSEIIVQGVPMAGEWCAGSEHWVLEYVGLSTWSLHRSTLIQSAPEDATHLGQRVTQRMVGAKSRQSLAYWRLWEAESAESVAPVVRTALFAGFEE